MAKKLISAARVSMNAGDTVEGFLLGTALPELSYKGNDPKPVPKLIMADKDGKRFAVLLGATALDDIGGLTPGLWTTVRKVAVPDEKYFLYELEQDDEKKIKLG